MTGILLCGGYVFAIKCENTHIFLKKRAFFRKVLASKYSICYNLSVTLLNTHGNFAEGALFIEKKEFPRERKHAEDFNQMEEET